MKIQLKKNTIQELPGDKSIPPPKKTKKTVSSRVKRFRGSMSLLVVNAMHDLSFFMLFFVSATSKNVVHWWLCSRLVSWGSEVTPSATPFFKRAYKISHPPGLYASWHALPSFTSSAQSAKIGLSKWIFYVKNHPNLSDFFSFKNTNLRAHFLLSKLFDDINF